MQLDEVDIAIVRVLSEDGRASYSEIAKEVGVSVGTIRNRTNAMRESGALHLNVWVDPSRVGLGINATFMLRVRPGAVEAVTTALTGLAEVGYVAALAGDYDVIADAFCRDVAHLGELLRDRIQTIDGVATVTTYVVTDIKYQSSMNIAGLIDRTDIPASKDR